MSVARDDRSKRQTWSQGNRARRITSRVIFPGAKFAPNGHSRSMELLLVRHLVRTALNESERQLYVLEIMRNVWNSRCLMPIGRPSGWQSTVFRERN